MRPPTRRGAPPRKPSRIPWKIEKVRSPTPFANVVERGPDIPVQERVPDTRTPMERWLGNPPPGRSALDQKRAGR